ncbi:MAG: amino acid permease [Verrucomicrobia bacterium CG_4_9_14_3_um_filter_43_20]|nr:MAG: amino acid permease [Verrucomicrobia bacterium CG1_02_43_26]PIP60055.1 MAG: amino acid permease [Verrucomicrobia bacterium CG22_combo_CG10-13_8_21_14_all_43_17]PIY62647.1 MAG: amino acid permease [Verrucomicrobia bacterium CG_4_10_14_0_8_um_filter_43_34]PJA43420.1 MAG: amino acid permease [Verrucomicrobia bacterium CG_4_9_14_3_um_filter_43_20]
MSGNKIGFWAVFALVTGSQIGTGVFMLPASLAPYGGYSLAGWVISGCGAVVLALVFGLLCARFPQTGGPHVYVSQAFGPVAAFFTGWTYWVISWVSTTAVVVTAIGSLSPFLGGLSSTYYLLLEIVLLFTITVLNLKGVKTAGGAEIFLTLLKFVPLLIIPLAALAFFDAGNMVVEPQVASLPMSTLLGQVALLTLWGFIGVESATAPAGAVENASKTIPRAIIMGTICVALLYLINSVGIMGLIPGGELVHSKAPYVDAVQRMFGGNWHFGIAIIASIVCIGTLNAWMLTSGQIVLGLAQDGLMPKFFGKRNENDAPVVGIIVSCLGITPLLVLTANESIAQQVTAIIDFSVTAFLFVYLACAVALLRVLFRERGKYFLLQVFLGSVAVSYCGWVIYETSVKTLLIASFFVVSGVPVYLMWYKRRRKA